MNNSDLEGMSENVKPPNKLGDTISTSLDLRAQFVSMIERDLLGPVGGATERIYERTILDRYIVGLLAPSNATPLNDPEDEQGELGLAGIDGEEGRSESPLPVAGGEDSATWEEMDDNNASGDEAQITESLKNLLPSSIGLTVALVTGTETIHLTVEWGYYKRCNEERDGKTVVYWQRTPHRAEIDLTLKQIQNELWYPDPQNRAVYVRGVVRRYVNATSVTLFLVNGQRETKQKKGERWLFQPELIVQAVDKGAIFVKRPLPDGLSPIDSEDRSMSMLYRRRVEFAIGHGVAVDAQCEAGVWDRAHTIRTRILPTFEVERMEAPRLEGLRIDMRVLAGLSTGDFASALTPLADQYELWIISQREFLSAQPYDLQNYQDDARSALDQCQQTLQRIRSGIALLDNNEQAADAFRFANQAMADQRIRSIYTRRRRQGEEADLSAIDIERNRSWRPFQLAFILLNLPALCDPTHPERSHPTQALADLLWFPTGGGKTEAYLGLAAFTIAIRRLQGVLGGRSGLAGVAVLMRYTLRLLTLQQYQRAATLIAACELIRRAAPQKWGLEPFRIGLWVGNRTTPNRTEQSAEVIKNDRSREWGGGSGSGTPVQLEACPWCGSKIDAKQNVRVESYEEGRARTFQYCGDENAECPFCYKKSRDEGLPILVVDEEIYRRLPTLLIATVDKFAQMPWKGETQMLFGRVTGYCPRHGFVSPEIRDESSHQAKGIHPACKQQETLPLRPPDLIIQDELHLISGPLGTLVGLYETVVDSLCEWQLNHHTVRPKVIASTATVRRAKEQVNSLYLRQVKIFPPAGLDVADNFFSQRAISTEQSPSRLYLGICASGTRFKTILIRTYVAAMAAAQKLYELYGSAADPYMTLVGYFNAMRELGGMRRVMDDAVRTRLQRMDQRGLARRYIENFDIDELTSRKSALEIPQLLDRLETPFTGPTSARPVGKKSRKENKYPLHAVLATNMVSVGVDVERLGLMVAAGQPKATAEYIQATSRVGRRYPGVVITVYNWARPRDLSHYERFTHYHATFYQQVEALSVTPFAPRALDRGLSGVLVAYLRLFDQQYNANNYAGRIQLNDPRVLQAIRVITERALKITNSLEIEALLRRMLQLRLESWRVEAQRPGSTLAYEKRSGQTLQLLQETGQGAWQRFTCLNSLRDVEPNVRLILNDTGMDRDGELEINELQTEESVTP